ncbi:MAG: DUF2163 domain-containing protein [Rhizobiales bacterium]|nr:DUF2163 domain-containing protein [Hyphomicrobiales bacterium]
MKSTVAPYHTAAWCIRIVCTNGTVARLTSYPFNLTMSNAAVYETDSGYEATAYSASTGTSPSAIDLEGIAGVAGISRDQIASGVFDNARVYIFKCNYLSPVEDYEPVSSGFFGKTTLDDDRYRIEGMALIDTLNQSVGTSYTALCSHTFGDAGCKIDLGSIDVSGAVTSVTSPQVIRDSSRAEAADYFGGGTIRFTTGSNAGLKALEIKSYAADGTITTFEPFYYTPSNGDAYVMIPGCRKRKVDCRDKWSNVINSMAFWDLPPSSVYTQRGDA